jgi:hypothetical protein
VDLGGKVKSAVAIAIDGVLRREIGYEPVPEGIALYRNLVLGWNVVLLGDRDNPEYAAEVEHFLQVEQLREHSRVSYGDTSSVYLPGRRARQVQRLRNSGLSLVFVVEADPHNSARIFDLGVNVLHFMHAQYARPDWRPDFEHSVEAWDQLVTKEIGLKMAKASDKRTDQ